MLQAKAKGFLSRTYLLRQNDLDVAEMALAVFKEEGSLIVKDARCAFRREKVKGSPERFLLQNDNGVVIASAEKPSVWKSRFIIAYGDLTFELSKPSAWKTAFALQWNGEQAGTISSKRWYSVRDAVIDLPEALPLEVQAFIFWLVVVQWTRDAAAAS